MSTWWLQLKMWNWIIKLDFEGQQNMPPPKSCGNSRQATPECTTLVYWWFWAIGTWKTANADRGFLWTPLICLKTDPPNRISRHKSPFLLSPLVPSARENWLTPQDRRRSQHHTQTNCHKLSYLYVCFSGPIRLPKNHFFSPKRPTFLLLFPYLDDI